MSFRQHNKDKSTVWRRRSREQLLATGLPDYLIDDEGRWNYVLHHGDDIYTGWNPDRISKQQAAELLRLLDLNYKERGGLELFFTLQQRINDKTRA